MLVVLGQSQGAFFSYERGSPIEIDNAGRPGQGALCGRSVRETERARESVCDRECEDGL